MWTLAQSIRLVTKQLKNPANNGAAVRPNSRAVEPRKPLSGVVTPGRRQSG